MGVLEAAGERGRYERWRGRGGGYVCVFSFHLEEVNIRLFGLGGGAKSTHF